MSSNADSNSARRGLGWLMAGEAANSVFCQLTVFGSVFLLFLDAIGLDKDRIGYLLSLFPFCGLLAVFVAPWAARLGLRRTYLAFWFSRTFVIALLILTPSVLGRFGLNLTFVYVAVILLVFAICRSIGETAWLPWMQEAVPNSIRGRFSALNVTVSTITGALAVWASGYVLDQFGGLGRFAWLIGAGVAFGFTSVLLYAGIPGGAPVRLEPAEKAHLRDMIHALQDRSFLRYLAGVGLMLFGTNALSSFFPLFMKEQLGLSQGNVVRVQTAAMAGGLLSFYPWGWAADRFGGKPVVLASLGCSALFPIVWLMAPRGGATALYFAAGLSSVVTLASTGAGLGASRLLYVSVVPPRRRTQYMALYYAGMGLIGGCAPIAAGWILNCSKAVSGDALWFRFDSYTPLFILSIAFSTAAVMTFRRLRVDAAASQ